MVMSFILHHTANQNNLPIVEPISIGNTPQSHTNTPGPALEVEMLVTIYPVTFLCRKCYDSCYLFIADSLWEMHLCNRTSINL